MPVGQKEGASQCHWHLAGRQDDQDPCACRCPRTAASPRPDTGQHVGLERRDLLIGETVGMKRVIADRAYDANRIMAVFCANRASSPSSLADATVCAPSSLTNDATKIAGGSMPCFAASRTFAASLPVTTSSPETCCQPQASLPPSHSGSERAWTLTPADEVGWQSARRTLS